LDLLAGSHGEVVDKEDVFGDLEAGDLLYGVVLEKCILIKTREQACAWVFFGRRKGVKVEVEQILSSVEGAEEKSGVLVISAQNYADFPCTGLSAVSDSAPPADHDEAASSFSTSIIHYNDSMQRDAESIKQIGAFFEFQDDWVASTLFGGRF
jgi:hypothetical protein